MKPEGENKNALEQALALLLRPLFRILLRQGMAFTAFEKLAKRVYVDLAFNEFGLPGKKPSISRTSILSGLTRKDVQRLLAEPDEPAAAVDASYNRAARVLTGWVRDAEFADATGEPCPLEADGERGFAGLVRRYSGDMPVRAVLDELLRVGAVRRLADGRIELLTRAYVPVHGDDEKLYILGNDVADLVATIGHNLQQGGSDARFQRKLMYRGIAPQALPAFHKLSAAQAQALLERLDRWLAAQLEAQPSADPGAARARVGLGIFYFEQMLDTPEASPGVDR
jgi:hypothetical protein